MNTPAELATILNAHARFNAAHPPARILHCHPGVIGMLRRLLDGGWKPSGLTGEIKFLTAITILTDPKMPEGRFRLERSDGHAVAEGTCREPRE